MKILKKGLAVDKTYYHVTCRICKCKFEFRGDETSDILPVVRRSGKPAWSGPSGVRCVRCPKCETEELSAGWRRSFWRNLFPDPQENPHVTQH